MTPVPDTFRAFRIHNDDAGYHAGIDLLGPAELGEGDTCVRVEYSSINYKDALAGTGKGKILRRFPLSGGIDMAGTVVTSTNDRFAPGE